MLKEKVAVITGSTSGIGLGIAHSYAEKGAKIVLCGLGQENEIEIQRSLMEEKYNTSVFYDGTDLSNPESARLIIENTVSKLGRIDILVNNAGIQHTSSIENFPNDQWNKIIAINLTAVFHSTAAALIYMRKNSWGRIINIASAHGIVGSINKSAYVASKHGVIGFTKVTALETANSGITVNAICPGWVRTSLVEKQISRISNEKKIDQELAAIELLKEKQPILKFTSPKQIGALAVFLSSDDAEQITGTSLSIDGGWTIQ